MNKKELKEAIMKLQVELDDLEGHKFPIDYRDFKIDRVCSHDNYEGWMMGHQFDYISNNYDGADEDLQHLCGSCNTLQECRNEIDELVVSHLWNENVRLEKRIEALHEAAERNLVNTLWEETK